MVTERRRLIIGGLLVCLVFVLLTSGLWIWNGQEDIQETGAALRIGTGVEVDPPNVPAAAVLPAKTWKFPVSTATLYKSSLIMIPLAILLISACIAGVVMIHFGFSKKIGVDLEPGSAHVEHVSLDHSLSLSEILFISGAIFASFLLIVGGGYALHRYVSVVQVKNDPAVPEHPVPKIFAQNEIIADRYKLLKVLGSGGYGEVWLAYDSNSGHHVAIKHIRPPKPQSSQDNQDPKKRKSKPKTLENEAKALESLDHPNIIKFVEYIPALDALVTEYVESSLHSWSNRLNESQLKRAMKQLLEALAYLHDEKGLMHMDIKPDNILVDKVGWFGWFSTIGNSFQIKLIDFGMIRKTKDHRGGRMGTNIYIAPEVAAWKTESPPYNEKVDIWSVGISAIVLMGGRPYKDLGSHVEFSHIAKKLEAGERPNLSSLRNTSLNCKDFVSKCLEHNPEMRPSAKTLLDDHPWFK